MEDGGSFAKNVNYVGLCNGGLNWVSAISVLDDWQCCHPTSLPSRRRRPNEENSTDNY